MESWFHSSIRSRDSSTGNRGRTRTVANRSHPINLISDSESAITKVHLKKFPADEAASIIYVASLTGFTHRCGDILRKALGAKRAIRCRSVIPKRTLKLEPFALETQLFSQLSVLVFQRSFLLFQIHQSI